MSLINDALKKAQKMRHEAPQAPAPEPVVTPKVDPLSVTTPAVAAPRTGFSGQSVALIALGAAALVGGSIFATVFLLRNPSGKSEAPERTPLVAKAPEAAVDEKVLVQPVTSAPEPMAPIQETAQVRQPATTSPTSTVNQPKPSANVSTPPAVQQKAEASSPMIVFPMPTSTASNTEAASQPKAPATESAPAAEKVTTTMAKVPTFVFTQPEKPTSNPACQRFVDILKIGGIRRQGGSPRVLINGQVYKLNDVVDRTLSLRLTEITGDQLIFVDAQGFKYSRNY